MARLLRTMARTAAISGTATAASVTLGPVMIIYGALF
jgi:hypothetical protein